ncbi:dihydrodipicolinate synthase family protein [Oharaeibacter diazotrophicus]|uniref:4-hydroxy-tetrahydrodipicolinate synthase n=1 Tax=Oharaeibacter diazotrophicus TaxID=1920512 RepID=A0A4R6RBZ9_9HYPH|nr:dihydrodipicolinate synthase family protein [Oharaeibacter diazotrophicus]TDP83525.1 4-hydroxy-tetrahydrodipicolinate synthase [Oharaeibacter diazotrophicus]BBE72358.1 L-2-keto-3-deoxyarabonate dehydratase [Pleomorphomonas sp. SM30]GLS79129.1 dihydrodipicolinate synthase family protein [Oharaeibacter diazotrophicus]
MALDETASGVFTIAATPFHPDGALDLPSLERLTDFYVGAGVDGITILGIMGEAQKLEPAESLAVARTVIGRAGVPVVVGVSAPGFAAMRALAREAMEVGAAGVMIAPPPALRTDDQIVGYYAEAVAAIGDDVPFVLQDYPLIIGVVIAPGVIRRIVAAHPSCVMLKHEDWPGLEKISTLRRFSAEGTMRRISILCGNGGLFLDFETERGADGAMTGYAFPEMLVDLVALARAGRRDEAHDLFDAHLPLIRYEQQPAAGLAVRKHVLARRGVIASDAQRRPGAGLTPAARAEVDYLYDRVVRRGLGVRGPL